MPKIKIKQPDGSNNSLFKRQNKVKAGLLYLPSCGTLQTQLILATKMALILLYFHCGEKKNCPNPQIPLHSHLLEYHYSQIYFCSLFYYCLQMRLIAYKSRYSRIWLDFNLKNRHILFRRRLQGFSHLLSRIYLPDSQQKPQGKSPG